MVRKHLGARHDFLEGDEHFRQRDLRQPPHDLPILELGGSGPHVALEPWQCVDILGGALEPLVFLQAAH